MVHPRCVHDDKVMDDVVMSCKTLPETVPGITVDRQRVVLRSRRATLRHRQS